MQDKGFGTIASSPFINELCAEDDETSQMARPRRVISNLFLHFIGEMRDLAELFRAA